MGVGRGDYEEAQGSFWGDRNVPNFDYGDSLMCIPVSKLIKLYPLWAVYWVSHTNIDTKSLRACMTFQ